MSQQTTIVRHLLTWLDVERLLKQATALWNQLPQGIYSIDCFADGMEILCTGEVSSAENWLTGLFGQAYDRDQKTIRLRIGNATYPVELVNETSTPANLRGQTYPLWRDVTYLPIADQDSPDIRAENLYQAGFGTCPEAWATGPDLVSFHSFKGGVGRTTALMTYVAACMQDLSAGPKKILVIDADLEAPGVSFWLDEVNRPTVSFVKLLEALHYPPSSIEGSVDFFAEELRKTSLNVSGMERELFILPAALDLAEIQDMPVAPEHLARNPANPWQLSDHLHSLG